MAVENHPGYKYCIRILSKRDYSRAKIRQKLIEKGHEEDAESIIDFLLEKKYLREDYYVESRIKGLMKKNYSPSYIYSKLKEEDVEVSMGLIEETFQEWGFSTYDQIEDLIRKKSILHNWNEEDLKDFNNRTKLSRFIQSKGHQWEEIKDCL